jgi:DivIVA domain-containing protein
VDQSSIERIRTVTFSVERRGYSKHEVDQFLSRIADWLETGGGDQAREEVIRTELERVGNHTAELLVSAQRGANQIRSEAEDRAAGTRERADAYAKKTREAADRDAASALSEAERQARELVASAEEEARRILEEGHARRRDVEAVISDLTAHRDEVAAKASQLADELREVSFRHGPSGDAEQPAWTGEHDDAEVASGGGR